MIGLDSTSKSVPELSIGMPVYNGAKYIREGLDVLLSQTFTDFELLISDNASTDETETICREYASRDARIRYVRQMKNRGGGANLRFLLDEAVGTYFMWAAADDKLGTPTTLMNLMKAIRPGLELAVPDVDLLHESKGLIRRGVLSSTFSGSRRRSLTELAIRTASYQMYGLFKRASLREHFHFLTANSDLACFGEGIFVHAVSANLRGVFVDDAVLVYRRHAENASSTLSAPNLLKSFFRYTRRTLVFYANGAFTPKQKVRYLLVLALDHAWYTAYLVAASAIHYVRRPFSAPASADR